MAEAGFPLRSETFHYAHRRGGWQLLPIDVGAWVRSLLPTVHGSDWAFLERHGYVLGGAYRSAVARPDAIRVDALPRGAWFVDREPVFSVTGPSAVVSWLEPLVLQLHFRIQVATAAALGRLPDAVTVSCERERELVLLTMQDVRALGIEVRDPTIAVRAEAYHDDVLARARQLVSVVGDADRLFEVGLRAASCPEQHLIALRAVRDAGILRTSNVAGAAALGMIPVGTMGHEHIQRHGADVTAYRAMRDRHPGFVFYLPDTFDTLASGVPAALTAIAEAPERNAGIRFDSEHGIVAHYLYAVARAREVGLEPLLGLESGWNEALTRQFEALREQVGWKRERQAYGYGGYLVAPSWPSFRRDDVSAVWKISQSGTRPTMKFGDEPLDVGGAYPWGGKSSVPGRPIVWRTLEGAEPVGFVAQEGERWVPPVPAVRLTGADEPAPLDFGRGTRVEPSPGTRALIERCVAERDENLARALQRR